MLTLGIDTGGTFTDFFLYTPAGIKTYKTPSSPDDPARSIAEGLQHFAEYLDELEIVHGTTVGTNAFLERKGAKTILITTAGFEDIIFIGRQNRPRLYDLNLERPPAVIPREQCYGVRERMRFDGSVKIPLGKHIGKRLRQLARKDQAQAVAVCLLHSYANPSHEQAIKKMLQNLGIPITLSSEILPEFREYERFTTTLINAYLAPVVGDYIQRLKSELPATPLYIQQSNGGILPAEGITDRAVHTILSGPAGGVHGALNLSRRIGVNKIITFDMGGTSTDVSLCDNDLTLTKEYTIDGFPVRTQVIDIHTVGAGGGSIAWLDAGGIMQVGPESAGAAPGPVCYGTGRKLTVTDANLFLGRLPDSLLGGRMQLHKKRVDEYFDIFAAQSGLDSVSAALGIIRIVNAGMTKAVRAVSIERGYDPHEFALVSFGGASGLHCCELAVELGIRKIIVPARAGILSAQGMVFSDPSLDLMESLFLSGSDLTYERLLKPFADLSEKTAGSLNSLCREGRISVLQTMDLRYKGQSYELNVPFDRHFQAHFHRLHEHHFGYHRKNAALELIAIRCRAVMARPEKKLPVTQLSTGESTPLYETDVYFEDTKPRRTRTYARSSLACGMFISGPAVVIDDYTTVLLPPDFKLQVDELSNLIISLQ